MVQGGFRDLVMFRCDRRRIAFFRSWFTARMSYSAFLLSSRAFLLLSVFLERLGTLLFIFYFLVHVYDAYDCWCLKSSQFGAFLRVCLCCTLRFAIVCCVACFVSGACYS